MIDDVDASILMILQENARTTNAEVARRLAMAPSAILERVRRLEQRGVIRGYLARVDPAAVGMELVAYVFLRTDETLGEFPVPEALARMPEVLEVHDIAGDDCYLLKVRAAGAADLHDLLRNRIARIEHVRSTRTIIVLKTFKEGAAVPLPAQRNGTPASPAPAGRNSRRTPKPQPSPKKKDTR